MKEYRILDHNDTERYNRYEVQERSRFLCVWGRWTYANGFTTQEAAIEYVQKLEDFYSQKLPIEIYRTRVK